jgi:cytochrome P450
MDKAQKEIDLMVGPDRLPDFGDFDALPYLRAMIKETLRFVASFTHSSHRLMSW